MKGGSADRGARRSAWMARAQEGDAEAYRALFEDVRPSLLGMLRRYAATPEEVEDLAQDVLVAVMQDPGHLGASNHRLLAGAVVDCVRPDKHAIFAPPRPTSEVELLRQRRVLALPLWAISPMYWL